MTQQKPILSGYGPLTTAEEIAKTANLQGKVIVITGGHSGIGLETTKALSKAGATIFVGARDLKKATEALSSLKNVTTFPLDLADPKSIDSFAESFLKQQDKLHFLINNAGVMALPTLTRDQRGYEMQFATNHLGHFQLTARLWGALKNAKGARVINLSSAGHRFAGMDLEDPNFQHRPYDKWKSYGQSKTANSLFTVELDQRGRPFDVRAFAVHPGRIVGTDLVRYMNPADVKAATTGSTAGMKDIPQGAATTVWCVLSEQLNDQGGVYCADCDISPIIPDDSSDSAGIRKHAIDPILAKALWNLSEKLTSTSFV